MKHGVWDNRAAVIESTITVGSNPVLELQLKILGPATAPDDERVAFDDCCRCDFTWQRAILDAPIRRIAFPARKGLPVDDGLESARRHAGHGFESTGVVSQCATTTAPACGSSRSARGRTV